jgi:hypothetical protein
MKITLIVLSFLVLSCTSKTKPSSEKIRVVFDSDTNNELDDQHALAYLLFNGNSFRLAGVTVNATRSGGRIELQYAEAERVMKLCGFGEKVPLYKGANGSFDTIRHHTDSSFFDGAAAVNFIIDEAKKPASQKLVVIAVGKLTNLALALKKEPAIAKTIRLVWLGSNYPEPGEYNLDNDTASVSYVLATPVEFEIVTVRYGKPNGSDVVRLGQAEVNRNMPGKGPHLATPVTGRHGGEFTSFGDYSVNLFEHIHYSGVPPTRALFDMVAVAIVKNPEWGQKTAIPAPRLFNNRWVEQPENSRKITVWGDFDQEKIMADFYQTLDHYQPVEIVK